MNELINYRDELNKIDEEILNLFEKRMEIVSKIARYKLKNNLPIFDKEREKIMIENNSKKIKNENFVAYYKELLETFLKVSKLYQKEIIEKEKLA